MERNWMRKLRGVQVAPVERESEGVPYLSFPLLDESGLVSHGFSTRMGGVSRGCYASMNLSFTRGDDPDHVAENYRRMAGAPQFDPERIGPSY